MTNESITTKATRIPLSRTMVDGFIVGFTSVAGMMLAVQVYKIIADERTRRQVREAVASVGRSIKASYDTAGKSG
jgi:hypothetical protein